MKTWFGSHPEKYLIEGLMDSRSWKEVHRRGPRGFIIPMDLLEALVLAAGPKA